jgi:hypothetical protein
MAPSGDERTPLATVNGGGKNPWTSVEGVAEEPAQRENKYNIEYNKELIEILVEEPKSNWFLVSQQSRLRLLTRNPKRYICQWQFKTYLPIVNKTSRRQQGTIGKHRK